MRVPATGYVSGYGPGVQPEKRTGRPEETHGDGADDPQGDPGDSVEFLGIPEDELTPRVRRAIDQLLERVNTLRGELSSTQHRVGALEELADSDALLPVLNRRAFMRELTRMIALTRRHDLDLSVIYIDVNGLKAINDTHGHTRGDAALAAIADALKQASREADVVARMGGDEFAILLPHESGVAATEIGQRLARRIAEIDFESDGRKLPLSVSFGVHQTGEDDDAQTAVEAADSAMYRHKRAMRDDEPPA